MLSILPDAPLRRCLLIFFVMLLVAPAGTAQPSVTYDVSWDDASTHYYDVAMHVTGVSGPTVEVKMPAWRPGRYVIQNYSRYVINFAARTPDGRKLPFVKVDKDTWRIVTMGSEDVVAEYQNYANVLDAGESYLDETEAYLNPISVLMYVPGRMQEPVSLRMKQPDGWRTATVLARNAETGAFDAADYHELVDTPFLVSPDVRLVSFDAAGATIDIAVQGNWEYDEARLIADHRAIVEAQAEIMQVVPFERYLFMYHVPDTPSGHGVEHKNSTSIVLGPASAMAMPADGQYASGLYGALLRVASHELFHAWNVERIRPEVMYPTDYSSEQYTTQMWIFEGITDYYADLALVRSGLTSEEAFLSGMAGTIGSFHNNPGRKVTSVAMSSFESWAKQGDAPPNTFYSFYTAGKALGVALDLEVRGRTGGEKSLDDVFRYLFAEYPEKDRGVPEDGFQRALAEVTGTSFNSFFERHIAGVEDVDWDAHLAHAGFSIAERVGTDPTQWMRVYMDGLKILGIDPSGAAGTAGLVSGDVLMSVGDEPVTDAATMSAAFAAYAPGDRVELTADRDGEAVKAEIVVGQSPVQTVMEPLSSASAEQKAIADEWLGRSN